MVTTDTIAAAPSPQRDPDQGGARSGSFGAGGWAHRAVLALIVAGQVVLSLRNNTTAFEDESLYLYAGHEEIAHILHGTPLPVNFAAYFSGAPTLYPPLAAMADSVGGLHAARLLSLVFTVLTTLMLHSITKRLFGGRAALFSALLFATCEGTLFIGYFATYDAFALFLLAVATWLFVRVGPIPFWPSVVAGPALVLAVGAKYAALLFVPTALCIAGLTAMSRLGRLAVIRPAATLAVFGWLVFSVLAWGGSSYSDGVTNTTTNRAHGGTSAEVIMRSSALWGGIAFVAAVVGACYLAATVFPRDADERLVPRERWARIALGMLLAGTALLVPAYQIHIHTNTSLHKHIAFGVFFCAPLAGYGIHRVLQAQWKGLQWALAALAAAGSVYVGATQAQSLDHTWPNSAQLVAVMQKFQTPGGHYLVEAYEVPVYYMLKDPDAQPKQFNNTYDFSYANRDGHLSGNAAYAAAIEAGYFQEVVYNYLSTPTTDRVLATALAASGRYNQVAAITESTSSGTSTYYVWILKH